MRVLLVKMSSLGDLVHTLPALTDAARALPAVRFDWVVEEAFAQLPAWHPAVDRVIPVALRRWRRRPLRELRGPEWRRATEALRARRYDALIDAQGLLKSAFIARLVAAPRYGMDWRSAREPLAATAYHHRVRVPRQMHALERLRRLFARALGYPLPAEPPDYGIAPGGPVGARERALLFLHGTTRAGKRWPESHWAALAGLAVTHGYRVWLPQGSADEAARAGRIASRVGPAAQALPPLDLAGLRALALRAQGAVAVDTGLGHLCAALAVPAVSLYGPTRPALVGTRGRGQAHLCAARDDDMGSIAPGAVWRALQDQLAAADASAGGG